MRSHSQGKNPQVTVILAMTADGKIADKERSPARFSSDADKKHLEKQISLVDAVLFGAKTLNAYGTSLPITNTQLIESRIQQNKPPQPIHIVVSATGNINPQIRFFHQSIPRWLLTTTQPASYWQNNHQNHFQKIIVNEASTNTMDWHQTLTQLTALGLNKLAILGGGELVASLLELDLIDDIWLTICPVILGGVNAPTPVEGKGLLASQAKRLKLLSLETIESEIFVHYLLSAL